MSEHSYWTSTTLCITTEQWI